MITGEQIGQGRLLVNLSQRQLAKAARVRFEAVERAERSTGELSLTITPLRRGLVRSTRKPILVRALRGSIGKMLLLISQVYNIRRRVLILGKSCP